MRLYRTGGGPVVEMDGAFVRLEEEWDSLVNRTALGDHLRPARRSGAPG